MKISALIRPFFLLTAALALGSCAAVPFQTPFNEADFKWANAKGSGAVDGQLYIEMKDKTMNFGRKAYVVLFPKNAYTTEYINRRYKKGENMAMGDDRLGQYLTDTHADAEGRFRMHSLAPGEYYVGALVDWVNDYPYVDSWGDSQEAHDDHSQFVWSEVSIKNGYTTHVSSWNQGSDINWSNRGLLW